MQANNVEIRVLIKGKPITEYSHRGSVFVEGREGSNFELEIRNQNPFRVEAVLSVDGVSVIDGQEAGIHSSGYLVDPNSSVRIPGWKLNEEAVAKFVFSGKSESYATKTTGSSTNNGVIGLMAFAERHRRPIYTPAKARTPLPRQAPAWDSHTATIATAGSMRGMTKGIASSGWNGQLTHAVSTQASFATTQIGTATTPIGTATLNTVYACASPGVSATEADASLSPFDVARYYSGNDSSAQTTAALNNLGTGFGRAEEFSTTAVSFDRGDMIAMIVLYYDNARGLKARGIEVGRPSRVKHTAKTPQAFPGMNKGCAPPDGWTP